MFGRVIANCTRVSTRASVRIHPLVRRRIATLPIVLPAPPSVPAVNSYYNSRTKELLLLNAHGTAYAWQFDAAAEFGYRYAPMSKVDQSGGMVTRCGTWCDDDQLWIAPVNSNMFDDLRWILMQNANGCAVGAFGDSDSGFRGAATLAAAPIFGSADGRVTEIYTLQDGNNHANGVVRTWRIVRTNSDPSKQLPLSAVEVPARAFRPLLPDSPPNASAAFGDRLWARGGRVFVVSGDCNVWQPPTCYYATPSDSAGAGASVPFSALKPPAPSTFAGAPFRWRFQTLAFTKRFIAALYRPATPPFGTRLGPEPNPATHQTVTALYPALSEAAAASVPSRLVWYDARDCRPVHEQTLQPDATNSGSSHPPQATYVGAAPFGYTDALAVVYTGGGNGDGGYTELIPAERF